MDQTQWRNGPDSMAQWTRLNGAMDQAQWRDGPDSMARWTDSMARWTRLNGAMDQTQWRDGPDSMARWTRLNGAMDQTQRHSSKICGPECWEIWIPEFNLRPWRIGGLIFSIIWGNHRKPSFLTLYCLSLTHTIWERLL